MTQKQMKISKYLILFSTLGCLIALNGCKKDVEIKHATLIKLVKKYDNSTISECRYQGQIVYRVSINVDDGGSFIYDESDSKLMGTCNFAWGNPDQICYELSDCEVVYRNADNLWGMPAVDKFGITK